jgi:hypothetical protein
MPLIAGFVVRQRMSQLSGFYLDSVEIPCSAEANFSGTHKVFASWEIDGIGRDRLRYVVVLPMGERKYGTIGEGPYSPSRKYSFTGDEINIQYDHLYQEPGRLTKDFPSAWICRYNTRSGVTREVTELRDIPPEILDISRAQFTKLQETPLWKQHLQSEADAETAQWWQKRNEQSASSGK